tara:strand:+ start:903 stop:1409 length:507 start_codon:yes stop_codon:yes gene_type:complete
MEWLGVLLLYLISGFFKKREQNKRRAEIESDPSWDPETDTVDDQSGYRFDHLLNDLFEHNPQTPQITESLRDSIKTEQNSDSFDVSERGLNKNFSESDEDRIIEADQKIESFEDNIYHSNLANRKELHLGNKWSKSINMKKELFNSKKLLRKSIVIKEILDKPLSLRE